MSDTPDDNVVPFQPPRRATVPTFDGIKAADCADCPMNPESCCEAKGEDYDPDPRGYASDVGWADICFIAERFLRQAITDTNYRVFKPAASMLLNESDAETVIRLMQHARIEVHCG
jgi:hypothetical protein